MKINTYLFGEINLMTHCPLVGATESLGFLTNVHESFSGIEERDCLRETPKQAFSFSYQAMSNFFDEEYDAIREMWAVPFLQDAQEVGTIAIAESVVSCYTSIADLRPNTLAAIYSDTEFEIVEIESIDANSVTLYEPTTIYFENAKIAPVRVGYFEGDIDRTYSGSFTSANVSFRVQDSIELSEGVPQQYKGNDLYFPIFRNSTKDYEARISKQQDFIDYDVGGFATRTRHLNSRVYRTWNIRTIGNAELYDFKRFLFRRKGMYKPFWMPLHENNIIHKATGTITNSINVQRTDMIKRKNLALLVNDTWKAVEVTNIVNVNGNTTRLDFASSLNIQAKDIRKISYLGLYRFNSDTIELNYSSNGVVNASIPIVEILG